MLNALLHLDCYSLTILISALILALIYEIINGFHDAANAVTIVIYTRSLYSKSAITISAIFNFLGVFMGGLSVAYAIVHLLPINIFLNNDYINRLMIISMLLSAITWNLSTWYFRLPTSSSHTLIGSIIGISMTNAYFNNYINIYVSNLIKFAEIILSLLISPLLGLLFSGFLIVFIRQFFKFINIGKDIHLTPSDTLKLKKTKPPFWIRITLILSSAGVSFSHGSNDGQKGIGLIMLILISFLPSYFIVNIESNKYEIQRTFYAINKLKNFYNKNYNIFNKNFLDNGENKFLKHKNNKKTIEILESILHFFLVHKNSSIKYETQKINSKNNTYFNSNILNYDFLEIYRNINYSLSMLNNLESYEKLNIEQKFKIRYMLVYISDIIDKLIKLPEISYEDKKLLSNLKKDLLYTIEYAPIWIIFIVAISLALGTFIGWKRIMVTISKKIGKKDMTYAQGFSAQLTTAVSIFLASCTGILVSTTHVLSSAIAGAMIFDGNGVRKKTIKNILLAWIFTIPATFIISSILYLISLKIISK